MEKAGEPFVKTFIFMCVQQKNTFYAFGRERSQTLFFFAFFNFLDDVVLSRPFIWKSFILCSYVDSNRVPSTEIGTERRFRQIA
jgi:hypothetical protein